MAQVPELRGQTVAPRGEVAYLPSASPPNGSAVASVLRELGETLQQQGVQMAMEDDKAAADAASVRMAQRQQQYMLDYTEANPGIKAADNLPDAYKALEGIRNEEQASLGSRNAQNMFLQQSRITTLQSTSHLATYAASERKRYNVGQVDGAVDLLQSQQASNAHNPEAFDFFQGQVENQLAAKAAMLGWSPEQYQAEVQRKTSETVFNVVTGMAKADAGAAQSFLDRYNDVLTPQVRAQAQNFITSAAEPQMVAGKVDALVARALAEPQTVASTNYRAAVDEREGFGKNPYSSAFGRGQFTEDTWLRVMQNDPQFANATAGKTRAQILALRSNNEIAGRAIDSYAQMNAKDLTKLGVPVNAATLGMAHGYGPAGAAKIYNAPANTLMQALIGDRTARINRVYNKTAVDVVRDFNARFGTAENAQAELGTGGSQVEQLQNALPGMLEDLRADPTFANNPRLLDQAEGRLIAQVNRTEAVNNQATAAAYDRLLTAQTDGNITDPSQLQNAYPQALDDWNQLPQKSKNALTRTMNALDNQWTPEKLQAYGQVERLRATNPAAFQKLDVTQMDLPQSVRKGLVKEQATSLAKSQKQGAAQVTMAKALANPYVRQAIRNSGMDQKQYDRFVGALSIDLAQWQADNPNKKPTDADFQAISARLLSKPSHEEPIKVFGIDTGLTSTVKGNAPGIVPTDVAEDYRQQYIKRYGKEPQPWEIGQLYRRMHPNGR